jgi:hypothetical protein
MVLPAREKRLLWQLCNNVAAMEALRALNHAQKLLSLYQVIEAPAQVVGKRSNLGKYLATPALSSR